MAQGASLMAHIHADPDIVRRQATLMREWLAEVCAAS
jgi:hypothetical protein